MNNHIVAVSPRGQITIPKVFREKMETKHFIIEIKNRNLLLKPLQTREEFFAELEAAEKDWEKNGGIPWKDVMKKADLL